ncbi:MAG: hypothetical protein HY812_04230 [Planctomycetes bacterium]|nr:hypothetical protein [Planctomycetota bacterium]
MGTLYEEDRIVRLGSGKRTAERLSPDFARFDAHVAGFLEPTERVSGWRGENLTLAACERRREYLRVENRSSRPLAAPLLVALRGLRDARPGRTGVHALDNAVPRHPAGTQRNTGAAAMSVT